MGEMLIHGDVEALIVQVLRNTPELNVFSPTISTDLRGYSAGNRYVMVTAEGGSYAQWNTINKPRVDLEFRADRRDVAHDIGQICLAAVFAAVPYSAFGATMTEVKLELGLVNVPDKEEAESYRYLASVRVVCTIAPS